MRPVVIARCDSVRVGRAVRLVLLLAGLSLAGCAIAVPVITGALGVVDRWVLGQKIERLEQKLNETTSERAGECLGRPCMTP